MPVPLSGDPSNLTMPRAAQSEDDAAGREVGRDHVRHELLVREALLRAARLLLLQHHFAEVRRRFLLLALLLPRPLCTLDVRRDHP